MLSERLHLRDIRNVSTFRLTLLFGLLFLLGVVALLGVSYALIARELTARSDRIIRQEATRLTALPRADLPRAITEAISRSTSRLNFYELQSADGRQIIGNITVGGYIPLDQPQNFAPAPGQAQSLRLLGTRGPKGTRLFIGRDITQLLDLRHQLLMILIGSGALIALLVGAGGVLLSIAPLKRVRALQQAGREIAAGNLDARMPLLGRGDELDLFAGTVNVMVDEVSQMVAQLRDVTDVIAHDLRSPLARVRSQISRLRQGCEPGDDLDDRLATAVIDIDMVLDRFAALLRVAELQASQRRAGFATVPLAPLVEAAADLYLPAAEERSIALSVEAAKDGPEIHGDATLLFEALSNLIDNAVKFTPEGGNVAIRVRGESGEAVIEVRDDGPGIAPEEHALVLNRFCRGSNAAGVSGSGIGLSVVMAIVHMHGFRLELGDAMPGLIARIHCPA